jgi:hypothetical protein
MKAAKAEPSPRHLFPGGSKMGRPGEMVEGVPFAVGGWSEGSKVERQMKRLGRSRVEIGGGPVLLALINRGEGA